MFFFVLGIPVSYRDVESIDPEYAKNLQVREGGREGREKGTKKRERESVNIRYTHIVINCYFSSGC